MSYGCRDHKARAPVAFAMVQDGWTLDGRRVMVRIERQQSNSCMYSENHVDQKCTGCRWAGGLFNAAPAQVGVAA